MNPRHWLHTRAPQNSCPEIPFCKWGNQGLERSDLPKVTHQGKGQMKPVASYAESSARSVTVKLLSQSRGVAGPRFRPWPGGRQPTFGGGLAGREVGPSPALAPSPPWLSILVQVSGAVQRFQRHLNILEAICQSWKLFGGSKNYLNVPESVAFAKAVVHGFQRALRSLAKVSEEVGGLGPEPADSLG